MRAVVVAVLAVYAIGCGGGGNDGPVEIPAGCDEFKAANKKITSDSNGTHHGNSEAAVELARLFSEATKTLEDELFSGGKENRAVSLTGDDFLTYCQLNESSVVFLVHVPQFKRYKGEVRDSLLEMVWMIAKKITEGHPNADSLEIAIGLRGSLMYGGSAIGTRGTSPKYENSFSIGDEIFYKYFVTEEATTEEPVTADPASDEKPESDSGDTPEEGQPESQPTEKAEKSASETDGSTEEKIGE